MLANKLNTGLHVYKETEQLGAEMLPFLYFPNYLSYFFSDNSGLSCLSGEEALSALGFGSLFCVIPEWRFLGGILTASASLKSKLNKQNTDRWFCRPQLTSGKFKTQRASSVTTIHQTLPYFLKHS